MRMDFITKCNGRIIFSLSLLRSESIACMHLAIGLVSIPDFLVGSLVPKL